MKRCPECYEAYSDQAKFCEIDGHELLADPTYSPEPEIATSAVPKRPVWWPAAALGIVIGVIFGAGIFAAALMFSRSESNESPTVSPATELHEKSNPHRVATASAAIPTPEPDASPSTAPKTQAEAEAEPSPVASIENKTIPSPLNRGPISTGHKSSPAESEAAQTIIEMTDGSKLDVDAAWEDSQGVWYRRSGLVSFVDSSRVKSITARRDTKVTDEPRH